jgi:hypothetical protein
MLYSGELSKYVEHILDKNRAEDWWARLHTVETSSQKRVVDQCALAHWFVVDRGVSYICYPLDYSPQRYLNEIPNDSTLSDVLDEIEQQWSAEPQKKQMGNELADFWRQFSEFHRLKKASLGNDAFNSQLCSQESTQRTGSGLFEVSCFETATHSCSRSNAQQSGDRI